jgi:hypothetical protein
VQLGRGHLLPRAWASMLRRLQQQQAWQGRLEVLGCLVVLL